MSKNVQIEDLLQKSNSLELQDFEVRTSSMKNVSKQVLELVTKKTEIENKKGREYEFTPRMMFTIFEVNNSKYYADLFWTHSDNPKNLIANPKNVISYTSPRHSVYKLKVVEKSTS